MGLKTFENEIENYVTQKQDILPDYAFSQYQMVKDILMFQNNQYYSGNIDSQGDYKYWFDHIAPAIDNEVKNIDFDTKDIFLVSERKNDDVRVFLANSELKEWLKRTGQAEKLNESIEMFSGYGNVVFKKVKKDYILFDPLNFYVINQTAKTLDDSPVIERNEMTGSKLQSYRKVWDDDMIANVLKDCKVQGKSTTKDGKKENTDSVYYEIYERNGEISLFDYKTFTNKEPEEEDKDEFLLAKVIFAGLGDNKVIGKDDKGYILYCEELKEMPYREAHRGRYHGRWWRYGLYEILMDTQIAINYNGNEIRHALEFGAKQIFRSADSIIAKNVLTDLSRGDIIKSSDIQMIKIDFPQIQEYVLEYNRLVQLIRQLANSFEVATGETLPSGTPFSLGAMMNVNVGKLFDYIREKLGLAFKAVFNDWILQELFKEIKQQKILKLTNNPEYIKRYKEILADSWYVNNLVNLGPHTPEIAEELKKGIIAKLDKQKEFFIETESQMWDDFKAGVEVVITGESINLDAINKKYISLIQLEQDPNRRAFLLDNIYSINNIDITGIPKALPAQPTIMQNQPLRQPVQTEKTPQPV